MANLRLRLWWVSWLALPAATMPAAALNHHLRCKQDGGACGGGLGYRDGRCNECDCCPGCWSCVELHHYECAERNGLSVYVHTVDLGALVVGEAVSWSVAANTSWLAGNVSRGWLQCASFPSLPTSLQFTDDGSLSGVLSEADQRRFSGGEQLTFFAVSTADWASTSSIHRLEIRFTIESAAVGSSVAAADSAAQDTAHSRLRAAFHAYTLWERQQLSHVDTVRTMKEELSSLKLILDEHPRLGNGVFWMYLGGLHMNIHKLMENCLLECELYLGLALLFPSQQVVAEARGNLDGCLAKRKLEAAKFMWMRGMEAMMRGQWADAETVLKAAATKKEGWGVDQRPLLALSAICLVGSTGYLFETDTRWAGLAGWLAAVDVCRMGCEQWRHLDRPRGSTDCALGRGGAAGGH
jgi:hypothetical protein